MFLDYKVSKSGPACRLRPSRPCLRQEIKNCSCSQTVHVSRIIKGLSMNNVYFCINVSKEVKNYAQNKDVQPGDYLFTNK